MKPLFVAVDGGGSGTRLWLLDESGHIVAQGEGGPSSVMAVGVERAVAAVQRAAQAAGLTVPGTEGRIAVLCGVIAGADRQPEADRLRKSFAQLFPGATVVLEHDGVGALLAGTLGAPGVLLLAGTGSLGLSIGPDGERVRVGGWGYLLGDEGSGYWIGKEGLRHALWAYDGRGPKTVLTERLVAAVQKTDVSELIGPVYRGKYDRPAIARWAPIVARAAEEGDEVAGRIIAEGVDHLARLVGAVSARAPWFASNASIPVVAAGGLFRLGGFWRGRLWQALAQHAPQAHLTGLVKAPIVGAAFLALQKFYGVIPADVMANLQKLRAKGMELFDDDK